MRMRMEFSHVCLVYVMPLEYSSHRLRGDAPGGLWSPHSLNRIIAVLVIRPHFDGNEAALPVPRCAGWGVAGFFVCRGLFPVALVSSPSAQAPPMAEVRDNTRGPCARIRHIPIHNKGDGGLQTIG